jgi:hypothetical protein
MRIRIQQLKLMRIRNPEGGREEGRRRGRGSGLRTRGQLRQQRAGAGGGAHRRVQGSTVVMYFNRNLEFEPAELRVSQAFSWAKRKLAGKFSVAHSFSGV